MPVAPSAALAILIDEPLSISTLLFESTVTAAPLVTAMEPPLAKRILSGAVPVAVDVEIGVVRAVEMTVSGVGVVCA
ncbi:hypothetical protein D3C72_729620 [compost metagenome]